MKQTHTLKIAGAVLATALATLAARAELEINESVTLSGYAAGSFSHGKTHGQNSETLADIDAAKIAVDLNFEPLTAQVSVFADQGAHDLYLLDANITCDLGKGFSLTAGRFLTWFCYEEFDIAATNFVTWSSDFIATPDYHEGVKIEYKKGNNEFGLAVLDSIYSTLGKPYRGDGRVRDGLGIEAHYSYAMENNWSLGINLGYQSQKAGHNPISGGDDNPFADWGFVPDYYSFQPWYALANIWADKTLGDLTLFGEVFYRYSKVNINELDYRDYGNTWYAMFGAKYQLNEKLSVAGRVSYGYQSILSIPIGHFAKFTCVPASYDVAKNLTLRCEVSYSSYSKSVRDNGGPKYDFLTAVQAVLKF